MKVIVASDSFKDCASAVEVCRIIAAGLRKVRGDVNVMEIPLADGGEGTAEALIQSGGGMWVPQTVTGPLPSMQVDAGFGWLGENETAIVEMACASGLELLEIEQRNPMETTTAGTGELILAAVEYGARKILLCIGGSATVDLGTGAAYSLGWRFFDCVGNEIIPCGRNLGSIERIVRPDVKKDARIEVLCDVTNPLLGENGAARVYGPQKGATAEMVEQLEDGLTNLAEKIRMQLGMDVRNIAGGGAAGGFGAGAIAFMNAEIVSGIDTVIGYTNLEEELSDADWVITGEGKLDGQSLQGKVVSGVLKTAKKHGVKTAVIAGQVKLSESECRQAGIRAVYGCEDGAMSVDESIRHSKRLLTETSEKFVKECLEKT